MKAINQKAHTDIPLDYPSLCSSFFPRPIRDHDSYQTTLAVISMLTHFSKKLNKDQQDYLDLLQLLIQRYEGSTVIATQPQPLLLLKQLVEEHRLRKSDLSRILGRSLSLCSMILNGQRKITHEHAIRLGKYFGRGPELFLT